MFLETWIASPFPRIKKSEKKKKKEKKQTFEQGGFQLGR